MPVMAPALNEISRPRASDSEAPCAVRTLARTETFMPMKPAAPDRNRADQEADRDGPREKEAQNHEDDDADGGDRDVLAAEIRLRTLGDGAGDLLHAGGAGIGAEKLRGGDDPVDERQKTAKDDKPKTVHRSVSPNPVFVLDRARRRGFYGADHRQKE